MSAAFEPFFHRDDGTLRFRSFESEGISGGGSTRTDPVANSSASTVASPSSGSWLIKLGNAKAKSFIEPPKFERVWVTPR